MLKKMYLSNSILLISIGVILISVGIKEDFGNTFELIKIILLAAPSAYIGIFTTYVVIMKKFKEIKDFFYDSPLELIRLSTQGNHNILKDVGALYVVSGALNFVSLYFLFVTPISSLFERIPGLQIPPIIANFEFSVQFLVDVLGTVEPVLPLVVIGIVISYVLRLLRRKKLEIPKNNQYPGSRAVLVFFYSIGIMMVLNAIMMEQQLEQEEDAELIFEYQVRIQEHNDIIALALLLSLMSGFAVVIVSICDRVIIPKFFSKL